MEPTVVVLPTPNPPAITILTGVGGRFGRGSADGFEYTDNPFENAEILFWRGVGAPPFDVTKCRQVGPQHAGHPDVQVQHRGDLSHRHRSAAQLHDVLVFE